MRLSSLIRCCFFGDYPYETPRQRRLRRARETKKRVTDWEQHDIDRIVQLERLECEDKIDQGLKRKDEIDQGLKRKDEIDQGLKRKDEIHSTNGEPDPHETKKLEPQYKQGRGSDSMAKHDRSMQVDNAYENHTLDKHCLNIEDADPVIQKRGSSILSTKKKYVHPCMDSDDEKEQETIWIINEVPYKETIDLKQLIDSFDRIGTKTAEWDKKTSLLFACLERNHWEYAKQMIRDTPALASCSLGGLDRKQTIVVVVAIGLSSGEINHHSDQRKQPINWQIPCVQRPGNQPRVVDMIEFLVAHGADVNAGLATTSPLFFTSCCPLVTRCLIQHGANPNAGIEDRTRLNVIQLWLREPCPKLCSEFVECLSIVFSSAISTEMWFHRDEQDETIEHIIENLHVRLQPAGKPRTTQVADETRFRRLLHIRTMCQSHLFRCEKQQTEYLKELLCTILFPLLPVTPLIKLVESYLILPKPSVMDPPPTILYVPTPTMVVMPLPRLTQDL